MKVTLIIYEIEWMPNLLLIGIKKIPNFELLFCELPNHFLHFKYLLGKTMSKLLITYGYIGERIALLLNGNMAHNTRNTC